MKHTDISSVVIIMNKSRKIILPANKNIFNVSQGGKKKILDTYLGSLVIQRNGSVLEITGINFIGYAGDTKLKRIFSFLNGYYRNISVDFKILDNTNFIEIRRDVIDCLQANASAWLLFENEDSDTDSTRQSVLRASLPDRAEQLSTAVSLPQLFDMLELKNPDHYLDILC